MTVEEFNAQLKQNPFTVLTDLVYQYILESIINSTYSPHDKINSKRISEELDISRTPIKIALDRLVEENYVEQDYGKGYVVKPIDWTDCLALYDVRRTIERNAAKIAANCINQKNLSILSHSIDLLKDAYRTNNDVLCLNADNLFHETIVLSTDNPYMVSMYNSIKLPLKRYQIALRYTGKYHVANDTKVVQKHIVIYNAIKNSYSNVAAQEMDDHLQHIYRIIFDESGDNLSI